MVRVYFYYLFVYERFGLFEDVCVMFLVLYWTLALRLDEIG